MPRVNLITNPRCENNITGYTNNGLVGLSLTTYNTFSHNSSLPTLTGLPSTCTKALYVQEPAASGDASACWAWTASLTTGLTYTFSMYAYTPASGGDNYWLRGVDSDEVVINSFSALAEDTWQRLSATFTANETGNHWLGFQQFFSDSAQEVYFTGLLLEQSASLGSYFDGATSGFLWDGTADASTSSEDTGPPWVPETNSPKTMHNLTTGLVAR